MVAKMFRSILRFVGNVISGSSPEADPYPSVILLLDAPREITRERAVELANQAWGSEEIQPVVVPAQRKGSWTIRVENAPFNLRVSRRRMHPPGRETNKTRQRSWDQHRAWISVDYPQGPDIPETEWPACFKLIFLMVHQLWDEHCVGLYIPTEAVTVPNIGDLIASLQWAANNGTPLPFLHQAEERGA